MLGSLSWWLGGGRERRRRSSGGRARRMVNDFTMNWPPNRRPFTSLLGLNETSELKVRLDQTSVAVDA
ncbi:hypothetical protein RJ639_039135 [Escallonia herrerae]|uniref:Uncharacterized protein n=1 Tax=Escallonia herrerae TaxID=1293975 RepID=A0AA88VZK1_9ASTE|nr:hypothetical protein RJ639_006726 [Escallonia herrerae]KAK3029726.1 hypothetical protein RJ639_039135 [Escallonia herrerae]